MYVLKGYVRNLHEAVPLSIHREKCYSLYIIIVNARWDRSFIRGDKSAQTILTLYNQICNASRDRLFIRWDRSSSIIIALSIKILNARRDRSFIR